MLHNFMCRLGFVSVVHWVVSNIPSSVTGLREGLESLDPLKILWAEAGPNTAAGSIGYKGPRPPRRHPPHHYHFQSAWIRNSIFVPRRTATISSRQCAGHVLAKGVLVGSFKRPDRPSKP